ncbi:translation initiation factor eIF-5A.2 (nucleomorph) [Chroomonas mesostigmatica CCMP1168]|uniref:Eukaryotic translation initiation factor 5A n=1 Tax=Chroomonas mesostigmatica CCMP1168 TaxID=1195612 RepID=J7GAC3_9CRYP|nr:translation initiation factor eIF-5A.2 [Chroomonas mesostigmatica CCMP1168]|mmetsp:Transcript_66756/g.164512  ORF Transcript_66756/g.164512 Transcript_66756/m.164512 type:complete len:158 (+) Transcript_66756:3558-4031(+)
MEHQIDFQSGDAGASETIPIQAGSVKKGIHVVIKGNPCKVIDITTSKTGKHGHAKASITGVDIFTGKKYQDISPTSHNIMQPIVNRKDYQLIEIAEDGFMTLMDEEGLIREDLALDDDNELLYTSIKKDFKANKNLNVTILKSMQKEKIISYKEIED